MIPRLASRVFWLMLLALMLAACSPAATPAPSPQRTESAVEVETRVVEATPAPQATEPAAAGETSAPATATPAPLPTAVLPTPTLVIEARVVELEWPPRIRLGDSDSVRLALIPADEGYLVTTEFPDNRVLTQTVAVPRPGGYELFGVARLEGIGFEIAPAAEQVVRLPSGEAVTWRWTLTPRATGQHRLTVNLVLRWEGPQTRESQLVSRSLPVQVTSFLGMTTGQAMWLGMLGLMLGSGMSVAALTYRVRPRTAAPRPNTRLALEPPPGLALSADERRLLQMLFGRYARLVIESEFRSGYSGARALLALPVRADGRADAHTIVKIGERRAIEREHQNYQTYVKDTLPPMTARIQEAITDPHLRMGALRYTFISEPSQRPLSLREALLKQADPALLIKLFETFGPNWWLQRRAHPFRVAQEYDRLLPAHLVLEPLAHARDARSSTVVEPTTQAFGLDLNVDDVVRVSRFMEIEQRQDGRSLSLVGQAAPGQPPLRVRWQSLAPPNGTPARVAATRATLMRGFVAGLDGLGCPDPLARLPEWLTETIVGSQSTIHGDLNLENVLVGPGGFVWLIDFAQTRDGHPLFDFAHLEAEIIAHILAPQFPSAQDYLALWPADASHDAPRQPLLAALHQIAARCLANPSQPREYHLALCLACLGALKYPNLDAHARHLLYLTAAHLTQSL